MGTFYGRVQLGEGIFWLNVVGWTIFIDKWGRLEVCFGLVGLSSHFILVDRNRWGWVEVYFGW